jgi:hypothetical protein
LVALFLDAPERASEQVPAADFLIRITKLAVIIWGARVAFLLVRIALIVSTYSQLEQMAFQSGVDRAVPPPDDDGDGRYVLLAGQPACRTICSLAQWNRTESSRRDASLAIRTKLEV